MISIAGRGFKQSEIRSKVKKLKRLRYIVRRRAHAGIPRSILFGLKTTNQGKIFTFQATEFRKEHPPQMDYVRHGKIQGREL